MATESAQLAALQQEGTNLLQASDVDLVVKAGPLKTAVQQVADQQSSALEANQADLQRLNDSIDALHKTALAVPLVQINPQIPDSRIVNESATGILQHMLGDSMKLVSCALLRTLLSCTRPRLASWKLTQRLLLCSSPTGRRRVAVPRIARWMDLQRLGRQVC